MASPKPCERCGAPARAAGLCAGCYQYRYKTGKDRPEALIVAAAIRAHEKQVEEARLRAVARWAAEAEQRRRARG